MILALEFVTDIGIHLIVALAHFVNILSALFLLHFSLHVNLVTDIIDLAHALLLLAEETIDHVCNFDLQSVTLIVADLLHHLTEFIAVFERIDFEAAEVFFLLPLLHVHQVDVLLQAHQFSFDTFENFIQEHRRGVTLAVDHLVVGLLTLKALLELDDSVF